MSARRPTRSGVAATEFALVIPLILLLTFGTLEVCTTIFLKEKLTIAAHEGARIAIRKTTSEDDVIDIIEDYLAQRNVDVAALGGQAITVSPVPERTRMLQPITVTVTAPVNGNAVLPHQFYTWFRERRVSAQVVMYKEFTHPDYEAELLAAGI